MASNDNKSSSLTRRLQLTAMAAIVAECVTFPIDMTKTRLQLQGEGTRLASHQRLGAFGTASHIIRTEGARGLFKGLSPAILRHIFYSPVRIVCYEQFRFALSERGDGKDLALWKRLVAGASSGALGQLIASPADLIKVRMQSDGRLVAKGGTARYTGVLDALAKIYREDGVKALWRGWGPNVQRAALVNLGELATYDAGKQMLLRSGHFNDNIWCHLCSSIISGFVSSVVSTPADVIKTRMMNQISHKPTSVTPGTPSSIVYTSSLDCLVKSIKSEGALALWKGFFPTWARLAPWQLTFWVTYEQLRRLSGVSSF